MKYVVFVPDGCADEPLAELDGRTPQVARKHGNALFPKTRLLLKNLIDKCCRLDRLREYRDQITVQVWRCFHRSNAEVRSDCLPHVGDRMQLVVVAAAPCGQGIF